MLRRAAVGELKAEAAAEEKPVVPVEIFGSDLYGRTLDNTREEHRGRGPGGRGAA